MVTFNGSEIADLGALTIARYGDRALSHIAEQIGMMVIADDDAGVASWKALGEWMLGERDYRLRAA